MLIGLSGNMGVGKSTALQVIQEVTQGNTALVKFAGVLYTMQEVLYEMVQPVYKRPDNFIKDRKLLQFLGTEWGRGLDQDLWIKIWKSKAEQSLADGRVVVCDDVRFNNEAEMIRSLGGVVIKITSEKVGDREVVRNGIANHASEAGISPGLIDCHIENNGSLEDYRAALQALYKTILAEKKQA